MGCGNPVVAPAAPAHRVVPRLVQPGQTQVDAIIYGAAWCGACRQAAAYFQQKSIPYIEKDIEEDVDARRELQEKLQAVGLEPDGIPVIDLRGHILEGFNPDEIDEILESGSTVL